MQVMASCAHKSTVSSYIIFLHTGPGGWNDLDFLMTGGQVCKSAKHYDKKPLLQLLSTSI